jgi:hypothetical protein
VGRRVVDEHRFRSGGSRRLAILGSLESAVRAIEFSGYYGFGLTAGSGVAVNRFDTTHHGAGR